MGWKQGRNGDTTRERSMQETVGCTASPLSLFLFHVVSAGTCGDVIVVVAIAVLLHLLVFSRFFSYFLLVLFFFCLFTILFSPLSLAVAFP